MARRSPRKSRLSGKQQATKNAADSDDDDDDDVPLAKLTAELETAREDEVAVRTSPRRPLRAASKSEASQALQRFTALREQRQRKVSAQPATTTLHARQESVWDNTQEDLTNTNAAQPVSHGQASDADWVPGKNSGMSSVVQSSDNSSGSDEPGPKPAAGKGRKRKARHDSSHPSKDAPHAANSPIFEQQQGRQSHQSHVSAHRQKSQKFIAGGDRRSVSGSDEGDVDDLIASEDDDQIRSQSGKQTMGKAVQPRSIKDKLDWSDSCSQGSQNAGTAEEKTGLPHQHAAEPANTQHRFNNAEIAGTSAEAEDEELPQQPKRPRQVAKIIDYEDGWETAAVQAQEGGKGLQPKVTQLQDQLEDDSDDSQQPAASQKRRLSKAASQGDHAIPTNPAAKRARAGVTNDNDELGRPCGSSKRREGGGNSSKEDQPALPTVTNLLAEEGLDPIEEGPEGSQPSRCRKRTKVGAGSIRDRIQQNQQRLSAGSKKSRQSQASPFLRNQMYEWHGDRMQAASSSDSDHSESEESEDSQQSQDGSGTSEHESDLDDFIVDVDPAAAGPDDGGVGPGPSATAVSAMLEEAGMVSSRTDKEHFTIYIEYLVYDLVDNTFAVRVRGNSRLRKHFDAAVRHVEESLAFKRDSCATSSAWMNAVPGFLDKIDTYPGLSSDLAANESSMDLHDGVCQACQRSFTVGHASKRLTLKGRPYKQLWQYGFRRVSDAHVRHDLPYKDNGGSDEEEELTGHQELQFAVGRYCCARLQMYHALVHYKHRLHGKLKKHIKHAHSMQQIRKQGADWVKAAKSFLLRQGVIDGLFRQYTALKDLATDYATKVSSSTWRNDQGHLGTEVDRLMYQLNSDSEGDEGSDIVPEDYEGSQSDDASDAENDVKPGAEHMDAAGPELASSSSIHAAPGKAEQSMLSRQPQSNAGVGSASQHSADFDPPASALEQTLPYEPGPSSLPSQQTLPYHLASSTQVSKASYSQQAGTVDLTDPGEPQELAPNADVQVPAGEGDASAEQRVGAEPTASSSPLQGTTLGSPVLPTSGSAKKQRQADIRGFLSPRARQHRV